MIIAETYKYLDIVIDNKLKASENIAKVAKKANQMLYFLRKLRKAGVNRTTLSMFYKSAVGLGMSFCISCWCGNSESRDGKKLKKVIKSAKKLGCNVTDLDKLYKATLTKKCGKIMKDSRHPLHRYFNMLKSGKKVRYKVCLNRKVKI